MLMVTQCKKKKNTDCDSKNKMLGGEILYSFEIKLLLT